MSRGDQGSLSLLWDKPILFNLQKRSFHFCDGVRTIHSPLVTSAPAPGAHKDGSLTLLVPACPLQKSNQLAGFKLDVNTHRAMGDKRALSSSSPRENGL